MRYLEEISHAMCSLLKKKRSRKSMSKLIYLDNAATTQVYPEVLDAMLPYFTEHYGNPAAIYSFAGESERAVAKARKQIADVIGAKTEEIYFTGGGSESDNWHSKQPQRHTAARESTLSHPRSSTMRSCTQHSGWNCTDLK